MISHEIPKTCPMFSHFVPVDGRIPWIFLRFPQVFEDEIDPGREDCGGADGRSSGRWAFGAVGIF